jgi:hypothetical protein
VGDIISEQAGDIISEWVGEIISEWRATSSGFCIGLVPVVTHGAERPDWAFFCAIRPHTGEHLRVQLPTY